jgi:hypothetical protein
VNTHSLSLALPACLPLPPPPPRILQLESERSESSTSALPSREPEPDAPLREKMARNEQLLNLIIAEQSTAEASKQTALDDLGIIDGGVAGGLPARRARPRRAVTWVNEIRYNLTEAVGSWAYMAPEVVLGQPYNEKVDVFR